MPPKVSFIEVLSNMVSFIKIPLYKDAEDICYKNGGSINGGGIDKNLNAFDSYSLCQQCPSDK